MIVKIRTESKELKIMRMLHIRMDLSNEAKQYYFNLKKGYEGEQNCDAWIQDNLLEERLIVNDLLFELNNSTFQIDTLIISQDAVYLLEIKNYEGDFYYKKEEFYKTSSQKEIKNPLLQLKRNESLLRQLFQHLATNLPIRGFVIFINPNFTLFQAPLNQPMILPTQLNPFMDSLNQTSSKLNKRHTQLTEKLLALHISESRFSKIPEYHIEQLKKGIICQACHSFLILLKGRNIVCGKCGHIEKAEKAILRSVNELKLLFPDMKITTEAVHDWCRVIDSKRSIHKVLARNFQRIGHGKYSYYTH